MASLDYLPDIFSLLVFLIGFRPLMRKAGSQANFWFFALGCALLHNLAMCVLPTAGISHTIFSIVSFWALDLCALFFLLAAASAKGRQLSLRFVGALAIPVLAQSALFLLGNHRAVPNALALALFSLPLILLSTTRGSQPRSMLVIASAFAIFAAMVVPLGPAGAAFVGDAILCLLFLGAAYLYFVLAARKRPSTFAVVFGLASWGASFPLLTLLHRQQPNLLFNRILVELPQYLVCVGIILTLVEEYVARTERLAMHDPLTDLPNRRLFEERLIVTMEEARLHRTTVACLVIDVDNFKHINDTLGHSAGDQLLRALAVRLSWHMSPRDILARTGGDEFTALLAGVTDEHHLRFIAGAMMSAAGVPIVLDGKAVDVKISVGIALSPDDADDIDSLRRAADEAMYSAKRRGGSLLAFAGEL